MTRNLVGLFEVMGSEDDGPSLLAELAHHSPERPTAVDIHGHGRLVQEDQFRIPGDGQSEADPLGFAPGQVVRAASEERSDAGALDGRLERSGTGVEPPDEAKGLAYSHPGRKSAARAGLEHGADPSL